MGVEKKNDGSVAVWPGISAEEHLKSEESRNRFVNS
jgi:hypothetical protein